ncbi:MAG: AAA family ATPase [Candidatus Acidiferrum sp.]
MTRYFLRRIQIEGFRGINNENDPLDVKLNPDAVNSVFAANGLGKSSLFEALSYAISETVPKLEGMVPAETAREYYCNRFHSKKLAKITLTLLTDNNQKEIVVEVERDFDGRRRVSSSSGHTSPGELLRSLNEDTVLLDNHTFGKFLADSPLDRGRSFSSLLGLSKLSQVRQALEMVADTRAFQGDFGTHTLEDQVSKAEEDLRSLLASLRNEYLQMLNEKLLEPVDLPKVSAKVSETLAREPLLKSAVPEVGLNKIDFAQLSILIKDAERSEDQDRLRKLLGDIAALEGLAATTDEFSEQAQLEDVWRQKQSALSMTRGSAFKVLYDAAKQVLEDGTWTDPTLCPACESRPSIPPAEFIEKQLGQYEQVRLAQDQFTDIWKKTSWCSRLKRLEADPRLKTLGYTESHPTMQRLIDQEKETLETIRAGYAALTKLDTSRKDQIEKLRSEKQSLENSLPPSLVVLTEQVERAKRIRDNLSNLARCEAEKLAAVRKLKRRLDWKKFIDHAEKTFKDAESDMTKRLTTSLDTQYKTMFATIACGQHVVPSLRQHPGSVELHLKLDRFFGLTNTAATPLLPESYRNALALSIFLSAALERKAPARFIVLDDVTSSFEAGHQFQVMEVLRTLVGRPRNPGGLQVIILSHDGLLEKYFDRLGNTKEWHHQHMQGSPPDGFVIMQVQDADRLRAAAESFLRAGQVRPAEPLVRQHLEYRLLQIIRKVNIPVPLDFASKDQLKMAENCIDAIKKSLALYLDAGQLILTPQQQQSISMIFVPALVSNWVSHQATASGAPFDSRALLSVLDTCDKFADCFKYDCTCLNKGTITRRFYRTLSTKDCNCP